MSEPSKPRVAVVGLGSMGFGMATSLRRAGFGEILCYDARDLGMGGQLGEGRTFYVATKQPSRGAARSSARGTPSSDR